jgi:hypothetical protein
MGSGGPRRPAASSRRFVATGFVLVAIGVLLSTAFALVQTVRLEDNARDIVDDMLTSIRLVGRIQALQDKRRILVDDHIIEKDLLAMRGVEAQIASTEAEIERAGRAYDRWAILPGGT